MKIFSGFMLTGSLSSTQVWQLSRQKHTNWQENSQRFHANKCCHVIRMWCYYRRLWMPWIWLFCSEPSSYRQKQRGFVVLLQVITLRLHLYFASLQDSSDQRQRLHLHQEQNHPAVPGAHLHRPEGQWGSYIEIHCLEHRRLWCWKRCVVCWRDIREVKQVMNCHVVTPLGLFVFRLWCRWWYWNR